MTLLMACNDTPPAESTPANGTQIPPVDTHTHVWSDANCTSPKTCDECGATEGEALGHSYSSVTVEPTCRKKGYTTYTCECGDTFTEEIDPLDHTWNIVETTAPSCTKAGFTLYSCECGAYHTSDKTEALGHTWTAESCTDPRVCSVCNESDGEIMGHTYEVEIVEPTCVDEGYKYYFCGCGADDFEILDALGHTWTGGSCTEPQTCSTCSEVNGEASGHDYKEESVPPTCTEGGYVIYTCECGDSFTKEIDPLGHSWEAADCTSPRKCTECGETDGEAAGHSYTSVVTNATCTEKGYTTYTCKCGDTYVSNETDALGHNWAEATCTSPKRCFRCAISEGSAKGHSYTAVVTAPTCTEAGYTTYTCHCGHTYVDDVVAASAHTEVTIPAIAPTCTNTGLTEGKKCSVCEKITVAQTTVAAKGHSYTSTVTAPACTKNGYTTYVCSCGDTYKGDFTDALGHDWVANPDGKTRTCSRIRCQATKELSAIPDDKNLILGLDKIPVATPDMSIDELRAIVIKFMRLQFSFGYQADMTKIPTASYSYYIKNLFGSKNYGGGRKDNVDGVKLTLENGKYYGGIPYTGNAVGSLYRWAYFYNSDTGVMDYTPIYYSTVNHTKRINRDYDLEGHPIYPSIGSAVFGNSCSSSIFWGWAKISSSMKSCWTHGWRAVNGYVQVGDYNIVYKPNGQINFTDTFSPTTNSAQTIYAAYAKLQVADGMVQDGHAILIHDAPVVVYDANGNIDPNKSYVVIMDQGGGWWQTKNGNSLGKHYSSPLNDKGDRYFVMCNLPGFVKNKYGTEEDMTRYLTKTFTYLYNEQFLPFTIPELAGTKKVEKATVSFSHSAKSITVTKLGSLYINSNYYISDVQITVYDKNGAQVFSGVYADESEGINNLKSASLNRALTDNVLYQSKTYIRDNLNSLADGEHYIRINCRISTGEVITVYTGTLTK